MDRFPNRRLTQKTRETRVPSARPRVTRQATDHRARALRRERQVHAHLRVWRERSLLLPPVSPAHRLGRADSVADPRHSQRVAPASTKAVSIVSFWQKTRASPQGLVSRVSDEDDGECPQLPHNNALFEPVSSPRHSSRRVSKLEYSRCGRARRGRLRRLLRHSLEGELRLLRRSRLQNLRAPPQSQTLPPKTRRWTQLGLHAHTGVFYSPGPPPRERRAARTTGL